MNWNKIKENYPKSFNALLYFLSEYGKVRIMEPPNENILISEKLGFVENSHIIEFFNRAGVKVRNVFGDGTAADILGILDNPKASLEKEDKAFEEAFEILEKRL